MDEQAQSSVPSANQRQMNTQDPQFLIINKKSGLNILNAPHNPNFYISQPLKDVSFKKNETQYKEHQKIISTVPNPQNQTYAFIDQNITAPLNIHLNSVSDDPNEKNDKVLPESDDQQSEKPSKNLDYEFQSDKLQKYFDFMKQNFKYSNVYKNETFRKQKFQKQFQLQVQRLQQTIQQNSIVKLKNQNVFTQVLVKNITQYANYQIVDLDICLGKYEKNVKIYHLIDDSCFHIKESLDQGTFGSIYQSKFMGTEFIVKCISKTINHDYRHFHNFKQKPAFFKQILKEYFIAYIAGVLEIAPKVLSPFGFDMIISKTCIEFFMQKCTPPHNDLENFDEKLEELKNSLFQLHLLNIVHNDIKPQNIMFHKKTGKLLFIDFGLSEYTQKPIGNKKQTKFIGTYQYASPEMQKLLFENERGMIDLYYNDAYGLNLAFNKLFQTQKIVGITKQNPFFGVTSKQTQKILNIIFLKFVIWKQKVDEAITLSNIIGLKNQFELQKYILEFILKIRQPLRLKFFYHQSFHESIKQNPKFKRLKEAYVRNISFGEIQLLQKNQDYKDFRNLYQHLQNMQHQISEKQTSFKQRSVAKLQKKQLLLGKNEKLSDQKLWTLYLDFVNFLKRNEIVEIQEKYEVSLFMIKRFEIKQDFVKDYMFGNDEYLPAIAQCLYFLLKECLAPNSKYFLPNRVPKLLSLLILLGWHIPEQYLTEWRETLSLSFENINQKIISYLDFQIIQQISLNRSFKFQNQKCLNQIDFLIRTRKQQRQGHKLQKQSFYDNLIGERKRQNINLQTRKLLNIVISMLQLNLNSKNIKEQILDQLVNDIEQLPQNIFKNKNNYLWVKSQLLFLVDLKFSIIRIDQEKQLKLLEKIKSLQRLSYHHCEVLIYHFQIISLYHNLKNFSHLKLQLEYLDQTINYSPVNQNMCVPRRLMLSYMLKDLNQFGKIIGKIQKIKIENFYDIDILRHTAYLYQNIFTFSIWKNTEDDYTELLSFKIETLMKQFAINFDQNLSLKLKKNNRLCFAQFVRAILAIGFQYCLKNENPNSIFSVDNLKSMLKVLQNLSFQFPDNEIITTYITQKMGFLYAQGKYSEACQFLENQSHIKFSDLNLSNYRQASILINYYVLKIQLGDDEKAIYINNMKQIYDEMIAKGSYNSIFNNRKLFFVILDNIENFQEAFKYFKAMSEHLSHHPSRQNVEILIFYLNNFIVILNKTSRQTQERQKSHIILKYQNCSRQKNNQTRDFVQQFYDYLRDEINFKRLWQNPYIILVLYVTSTFCKKYSYEVLKVFKIICNNMKYLNYYAKSFILKNYYELVNIKIQAKSQSKRKHTYLLKKHFKVTSQTFDFQSILNARSNKQNLLSASYFQFPGQSNMRKKLYRYYNNLQVLNKNNYFDSFSTFSSEKSLTDSI